MRGELRHRERQINALRRISEALFSQAEVAEMLRETLDVAIEVLEADVGSLQLHNAAADTLIFRYVSNSTVQHLVGHAYSTSQGIGGQVFRSAKAQLTQNVGQNPAFNSAVDALTGYATQSMLTVPLKRLGGAPLGIMQILNARRRFDARDLEVLEVLSAHAAAAIETARLAQEAKRAEIVHVLGDVSHDIKNLLTPIQSGILMLLPELDAMFEALDKDALDKLGLDSEIGRKTLAARQDYRWILENAQDCAGRVQRRTKEIADAVKGEIAPPQFQDADINETARAIARSLRLVAQNCGIELHLELDFSVSSAQFDPAQLYNALYNLVNNAIPETPEGGSITIRTQAPRADEGYFTIEVEDTGRGIPEAVRVRLFTDAAISTKPGGTGLGTRIVAGVVARHGGTISVQSAPGFGSTFTIRLPLCQNRDTTPPQKEAS